MTHAVAPIHDPLCAARSFDAAAGLIERVPVVRLGLPEERRVVPITWGRSDAALDAVDAADVRVVQRGQDPGLSLEPGYEIGAVSEMRGK